MHLMKSRFFGAGGLQLFCAVVMAVISFELVSVSSQEPSFFEVVSDPFMPPWPNAPPNGPVHLPTFFAVPNGGGSIAVMSHAGRGFGLNNFNQLPIQQSITNAGSILAVQDVVLNWGPFPNPGKAFPTMTVEQRFIVVGTNNSDLVALQDNWWQQTRPQGSPPTYNFARGLIGPPERTIMSNTLGQAFIPSDFCDMDNDNLREEIIIGGASGKFLLFKIAWNNPADTNPTIIDLRPPNDPRINYLNTFSLFTAERYSKPTCAPKDAVSNYVIIGFRSGLIVAFEYQKATYAYQLLESVYIDPAKFIYSPPSLGAPPNNLFAMPALVDLDYDNFPDAVAVGYKNGATNLMFFGYSNTGGCTPPTCSLGYFQLGCACSPCPAGTYRSSTSDAWCRVCGGPDKFCEEGAQYPQTRPAGSCTKWSPYPSPSNPSYFSPNYIKDVVYYTENYGGAKVLLEDNSEVDINTFWTTSQMHQEMFGGMKSWRNRIGPCGLAEVDFTHYYNLIDFNQTNGFVRASPMTKPNDGTVIFFLKNNGEMDVNITFNFLGQNSFLSVLNPRQNFNQVTRSSLKGWTHNEFYLRVQTGSIPTGLTRFNVTIEILTEPYWKQRSLITESEATTPLYMTFELSLEDAVLLVVPASITIETTTNTIETRMAQIFSLQETDMPLAIMVSHYNGNETWLSAGLDGGPPTMMIGAVSKCEHIVVPSVQDECRVKNQETPDFSRNLKVTVNTTGLLNGMYFANVLVPPLSLGVNLIVRGGLVDWSMSTLHFQDTNGQLFDIGTDPQWRVGVAPQVVIIARDALGNPTDQFSATQLPGQIQQVSIVADFKYDNSSQACPYAAQDQQQCQGSVIAITTGEVGTFSARMILNAQGPYIVTIRDPNGELIGTRRTPNVDTLANPMIFNMSARVCTDPNAVTDPIGSECLCKPGYGVAEGFFAEVTCNECEAGFYSEGGRSSCLRCPEGTYQNANGQSTCKRCANYKEAPAEDKKSCKQCEDFQYVQSNTTWTCQGCGVNQRVRVLRDNAGTILTFPHPYFPELSIPKYTCACLANMYWSNARRGCVECPAGGFCVDRNEEDILPRSGFWGPIKPDATVSPTPSNRRLLQATTTGNYTGPYFIRCRREESCPGVTLSDSQLGDDDAVLRALLGYGVTSNSSLCTQCEEGFTGPLCFKCAGGYTRAGVDSCTKCLSRSAVVGLLIMGAIFAIAVCVYIIRRTLASMDREDDQSDEMILLRVLMSHLQSESMVQGIDLNWPAFVMGMYDIFNLISSTGQSAFSLDCFVDEQSAESQEANCGVFSDDRLRTFFLSALFIALLPLFGFLCSSLFWLARYAYIKRTTGKGRGRSFYQYNLVSIIIIVFLLYPTLVRTGFKFFSASSETIAGYRFLEADFNIVFYSTEHLVWAMCLGLPMIILYAVGIPVGFLYILKTRKADTHRYGKVFTFLYTGFKPDRYFWEIVIMARKGGIAACTIMLKPYGSDIQAFATSIVVFVSICLQLHVRPYTHDSMNFVEFFGLGTLYMTLFLGLFQSSANENLGQNADINLAFGLIIVLINTLFLVFIFGKLFAVTYHAGREKGWRHVALMVVTLGQAGATSSKRLTSSPVRSSTSKRMEPSNSISASANPIFSKEASFNTASAMPAYDDVYGGKSSGKGSLSKTKKEEAAAGDVEHVDYTKPV